MTITFQYPETASEAVRIIDRFNSRGVNLRVVENHADSQGHPQYTIETDEPSGASASGRTPWNALYSLEKNLDNAPWQVALPRLREQMNLLIDTKLGDRRIQPLTFRFPDNSLAVSLASKLERMGLELTLKQDNTNDGGTQNYLISAKGAFFSKECGPYEEPEILAWGKTPSDAVTNLWNRFQEISQRAGFLAVRTKDQPSLFKLFAVANPYSSGTAEIILVGRKSQAQLAADLGAQNPKPWQYPVRD